jgi:putative hydrolase of the HAD superfamily
MAIKVVAFDLDGTLYPVRRMYFKSLPVLLRHPWLVYCFNKTRKQIRKIRPIPDFYRMQTEMFARNSGMTFDKADRLIKRVIYAEWFERFRGVRPYEGIRPVVEELRRRGIKVAVVSDYPVEEKLNHIGLRDIWDTAFTSEATGYLKPNPEPFLKIMDIFGIKPEELLYVGDDYHYDVIGAGKLGIKTAYRASFGKKQGSADMIFRAYSEFLPQFNRALSGP